MVETLVHLKHYNVGQFARRKCLGEACAAVPHMAGATWGPSQPSAKLHGGRLPRTALVTDGNGRSLSALDGGFFSEVFLKERQTSPLCIQHGVQLDNSVFPSEDVAYTRVEVVLGGKLQSREQVPQVTGLLHRNYVVLLA